MNAITLYEIYTITRENKLPDLTIGLAMYHEKHPGVITHEQDKQLREFMGKHGQELAKAYPDPVAFAKVVAAGVTADDEAVKQAAELMAE